MPINGLSLSNAGLRHHLQRPDQRQTLVLPRKPDAYTRTFTLTISSRVTTLITGLVNPNPRFARELCSVNAKPSFTVPELCSPQTGCVYKDGAHYLCCESYCGPYGPDGNTPLCNGKTTIPANNNYPPQASNQPPSQPPPPSGDQGRCSFLVVSF